ncbi:MAG: isocitrate/isopropylmalate dehydrogenase family protein [Candidatus Handelsmanbacteria bacterium]|nr:isocitrate/isopropylmalate dehydrogenase family protein [Candidatus Handelsmanbacteria bacterium]
MGGKTYQIAVLKGDGIGIEVTDEALKVLGALAKKGGPSCAFAEYPAGANCYLAQGAPLPAATVEACRRADAVLLGAMGLPQVRWPDGTEMRPQVDLRIQLDLYAGVRPAYLYAAHHTPLKGKKAGEIDLVVLRENVEGLFASLNGGIELRGEVAVDSMVITRSGTERLMRYAFELARQRGKARPKVTCVDKANIFRSMAFFRRLFDEAAAAYPEVLCEYAYVDAMSLYLVRQPEVYDVLVMENMFGDILSDLAAGLVGGLGMAPSADIGEAAAVFQPVHGTAPDIAGQGIANPVGAILSAGLMLRWLGTRHGDQEAVRGGERIEEAVRQVLAPEGVGTPDIGGRMSTAGMGDAIAARLR